MEEQLVVFELAHEYYGVDISHVQEIDRMAEITTIPEAPPFVEGVINLRGHVIPIMDLRSRFGLPRAEVTPLTRIVVAGTGDQWVGMIVDAVSEVLRVPSEAIDPPSSMVMTGNSGFMRGIAKLEGRLIIVLQLERVLDHLLVQ
jgi:purine-binding chemotaxis protein CheW